MKASTCAWKLSAAIVLTYSVAALAGHNPAPVPPGLEIEVLDPNVDPVGNPTPIPVAQPDGLTRIVIPPTLLVHRFYYTGDRTFQAQFLKGGPCIVVVNHPKTGVQLNVPVQMLPGAPRVTYRHDSIEYDFGNQAVTIKFCWLARAPKVEYRNQSGVNKVQQTATQVKNGCTNLIERTNLPTIKQRMKSGGKNVLLTAVDNTAAATRFMARPFAQIARMLPGSQWMTSSRDDQALELENARTRTADLKKQSEEIIYVPATNGP